MMTKITRDVLEGYVHCRLKGHLKLAGQQGTPSDYEALHLGLRDEARLRALDKILAKYPADAVERNVPLTASALKRGAAYLLDALLEDDVLCLTLDGLKKVDGPSKLGDFHYVPVLFHESRNIRKEQRLLLEVYGLLLSRVQARAPAYGVVWHRRDATATRVRLSPDPRKAEQVL
jgi:predicted RecB family nuclease